MGELKRYSVNLRDLSVEERHRVIDILDHQAAIASPSKNDPLVYKVYWNDPQPIEEAVNLPARMIRLEVG